jgi:N-acetylglucosamine-6-phosphate deacetylase
MFDPTTEHIQQMREVTGDDPVLITLAPERNGALEAIALAVKLRMRVSLGHTNASVEILRQAVAAGATGFTHLGNACPQLLDRHDNILWRVLDTHGLTVSLIPDTIHVSPPLFRLVHRVLVDSTMFYTTDAVAPAGAPPGLYTVGPHRVQVGADRVVRQPGRSNYAGSALTPIEGIRRAATMLSRSWPEAWALLSTNPARFMGWQRSLTVGTPANLVLLKGSASASPDVERVYVEGRLQWAAGVGDCSP